MDYLIAVRMYRENRKNHIDTVFYKKSMIFNKSNKEILNLIESEYSLSYKLSGVSPQWTWFCLQDFVCQLH